MNDIQRKFVEQLYLELETKLKRYARKAFNDESLVEEAVQDTFRDVCSKVDVVMASPNPQGWVMNAMTYIIKQIANQRVQDTKLASRAAQLLGAEQESSAYGEIENDVDTLYGNLKNDADYILFRDFVETQCTVTEYAKRLGISPSACYKRLERSRKRLRKYFEDFLK